jgi:hypothetical protein
VGEAAELLGIGALLGRRPRQLSGGQRQRVAMGRAIVREPALFLFDEPLSNLDARLRVQMRAEIRRLQRRLGVTSLFVTHDQTEAMTLGDRLVVMHAGHAAQVATPMEIWARPANTFVAGFIGSPSMNLLEAQLAEEGRAALLRAGPSLRFADGARPGPAGGAFWSACGRSTCGRWRKGKAERRWMCRSNWPSRSGPRACCTGASPRRGGDGAGARSGGGRGGRAPPRHPAGGGARLRRP